MQKKRWKSDGERTHAHEQFVEHCMANARLRHSIERIVRRLPPIASNFAALQIIIILNALPAYFLLILSPSSKFRYFEINSQWKLNGFKSFFFRVWWFIIVRWIYTNVERINRRRKEKSRFCTPFAKLLFDPSKVICFLFLGFYGVCFFFCFYFCRMLYLRINGTEVVYRFFSPYDTAVFIGGRIGRIAVMFIWLR